MVLVIPDVWDRFYVHELVNMLLSTMGFKQVVCQQVCMRNYTVSCASLLIILLGISCCNVWCGDIQRLRDRYWCREDKRSVRR